jgi:hypothetical protein
MSGATPCASLCPLCKRARLARAQWFQYRAIIGDHRSASFAARLVLVTARFDRTLDRLLAYLARLFALFWDAACMIVAVPDLLISRERQDDGICRKAQRKIQQAPETYLPASVMGQTVTVANRPAVDPRKRFRRIRRLVQAAFDAIR